MAKAIFVTLLGLFLFSACAQPTRVEKNYGKSIKQSRSNQMLNPEAGKNQEPVIGLDGKAAQGSLEKYRESFKTPQETPQPLVQTGIQTSKGKE